MDNNSTQNFLKQKEQDKNQIYCSLGVQLSYDTDMKPEDVPVNLEFLNTNKVKIDEEYEMAFSELQFDQMIKNFREKTLGRDVPVNLDHPRRRLANTEAFGWVTDIDKKKDGDITRLFATIRWNKMGQEMIASGAYRYTSIGAFLNYTSHQDGKTGMGMTLFEISLTNDPAFLALPAITESGGVAQLSNIIYHKKNSKNSKEGNMDTEKQILELNKQIQEGHQNLAKANLEKDELQKSVLELNAKLDKVSATLELTERGTKLDKLILEKKMTPAQKEKALTLSKENFDGFLAAIETMPANAYDTKDKEINMSSKTNNTQSAETEVLQLAQKLINDNNTLQLSAAISNVLAMNPELEKRFNSERANLRRD